ncbi:hypothetical protein TH2_11439 [Thalassospira profundimaris WP0211]|nr:hypothetical protein TH2_11439 [Thalassospira profundimaris WP0211]
MNNAPKPKTSPCFGSAFGLTSTDFAVAVDLAGVWVVAGVAAGLETADSATTVAGAADFSDVAGAAAFGAGADFDAVLAGAAAAFFGADLATVFFFGAAEAADLLVAVVLGFVLTVLAFSLLVGDLGAVDLFAGGVTSLAGRAAPEFATEGFVADSACFDAGPDGEDVSALAGFGDSAFFSEAPADAASLTGVLAADTSPLATVSDEAA